MFFNRFFTLVSGCAVGAFSIVMAHANTPTDANFDRVKERQKMIELATHLPQTSLVVKANIQAEVDPQKHAFVEFFRDKIWPRLSLLKEQENRFEIWMVAIDRALYNDESEKAQWKTNLIEARNKLDSILSDSTWTDQVERWAALSKSLKGPLAEYSRTLKKQMDLSSYPPEALPLLHRLNEVMAEINKIKNESPIAKNLPENAKKSSEIVESYFKGTIRFNDAWKKLEDLQDTSRAAMSQDIALRGKNLFNEAAILRTKIAKIKGFNNWAELVLARQASTYSQGARTPTERLHFLRGLLDSTKAPYKEYLKKSVSVVHTEDGPLTVEKLRPSQLQLIAPEASTLIREYFPLEKIEDLWRKTMLESGVDPKILETITLDGYPRENKQTHAYMANLSSHKPVSVILDSEKLEIQMPPISETTWYPAQIFIVQNYRDDGPAFGTTAFHEGGHGLDYSHRENPIPTQEEEESSNSYSETHSMFMERFYKDVEFLVANGQTRDGRKLPVELAQKYIVNSNVLELGDLRSRAATAMYDIELWNFSYEENGVSFLDRAHEIYPKFTEEARLVKGEVIKGVDPGYSAFATDHFFGGQVRYIGYVYADMAAQMTAEYFWDRFEKETGRRSFYRQPNLIPYLREGYYRRGYSQEFPRSVEAVVGRPFSPEAVVGPLLETVRAYRPTRVKFHCEALLVLDR